MKVSKKCAVCGEEYFPRPDKYERSQTCSKECRGKFANAIGNIKRTIKWDNLTDEQKKDRMKEAFFKHVHKTDSCWNWLNANKGKGKLPYGTFSYRRKRYNAHRLSWQIHNGEIAYGMWVLHTCDNASCVNPDHLYLGTPLQNQRDKLARGRCVVEKLSIKQVKEIRQLLERGVTSKRLAEDYGVSTQTIHCIKYRKTWRDV